MSYFNVPIKLLIISAFVYLLGACESTPPAVAEGTVNVSFTVDCVQLVCTVDVSSTINGSDTLDSLLCDMGDGNQVDPLTLETIFDYTYAAPSFYDITCTAQSSGNGGKTDSATVSKNVDGVLINAGPDQVVSSGTTVTLDGSASEAIAGSPITTYRWRNIDANFPRLTLVNADTVNPTFLAPRRTDTRNYRVSLRVSIDGGENFSDNVDFVDIRVIPGGGSDLPQ